MTNDVSETNPEDAVPCFALSKNDSYVMSASGGKIALFNMMTFKVDDFLLSLLIYCTCLVSTSGNYFFYFLFFIDKRFCIDKQHKAS